MLLQESAIIVSCPICGRRAKVGINRVKQRLACAHCGGPFVAAHTSTGFEAVRVDSALGKRSHLLDQDRVSSEFHDKLPIDDHHCDCPCNQAKMSSEPYDGRAPVAFVIEHRDEVFARIGADIREAGYRVVRASSGTAALKSCGRYEPTLVVANIDLPDTNGWRLAFKLALIDSDIRVLLYCAEVPNFDLLMADLLKIDAPIEYRGDLMNLSQAIVARLAGQLALPGDGIAAGQGAYG